MSPPIKQQARWTEIFTNANLTGAILDGANLDDANLSHANLTGVRVMNVTTDSSTICLDGGNGTCSTW